MPDVLLDTRDLICPLPLLKTKKTIDCLQPGQLLEVTANDGAAQADIVYLIQRLKLELIDVREVDGSIRITIKK